MHFFPRLIATQNLSRIYSRIHEEHEEKISMQQIGTEAVMHQKGQNIKSIMIHSLYSKFSDPM